MGGKYKLYILLYLFLFIYFPPLLSFNLLHVLTIYSIIALLVNYKKRHYKPCILVLKEYYILPFLFIILYLLIIAVLNGNSVFTVYTSIILGLEVPICIIYLCAYFLKREYSLIQIYNTLLYVALIQAFISIFVFFVPTIKEIVVNLYIKNQTNDYVSSNVILYMAKTRLNGLSSNITFTTPVVQSMVAIIVVYLSLHKNYKYIYAAPILAFSAIINSRSSLVVLGAGLILVMMSLTKKRSIIKKLARLSLVGSIVVAIAVVIMSKSDSSTFDWISSGFNEIVKYFQGEKIGYFDIVFSNFLQWPKGVFLIMGTGKTIFAGEVISSDVGYVNDVWLGGIIYTIIAYGTFGLFYYNAYRKQIKLIKFTMVLFVVTFILMNIKGSIISNNDFMNVTIFLTTVFILYKRKFINYE